MAISRADFNQQYRNLIVKQYYDKPRAREEIKAQSNTWFNIYEFTGRLAQEYDIDQAFGVRLDVLGRVVGFNRQVPFVVPKPFFGFADNPDARGFASKFDESYDNGGPLSSKFLPTAASLQLGDADYQFYLKLKVMKNTGNPIAPSGEFDLTTAQDAVQFAFNGMAYIVDNQDMTATIFYDQSIDDDRRNIVERLDLLPRPAGVKYVFEEVIL